MPGLQNTRYNLSRNGYFMPSATGCFRSDFRSLKRLRVVITDECGDFDFQLKKIVKIWLIGS